MIPLLTTEIAGKGAPTDAPDTPDTAPDNEGLFAAVFASEADAQKPMGDALVVLPTGAEAVDGDVDDVVPIPSQDVEIQPKQGKAPEAGFMPPLPGGKTTAESEITPNQEKTIVLENRNGTEKLMPVANAEKSVETINFKETAQSIVRPSIAQSAIESKLPVVGLPSPPSDTVVPAKLAELSRTTNEPVVKSAHPTVVNDPKPASLAGVSPIALTAAARALPQNTFADDVIKAALPDKSLGTSLMVPNTVVAPIALVPLAPSPAVAIAQSLLAQDSGASDKLATIDKVDLAMTLGGGERSMATPTAAATAPGAPAAGADMARHAATQIAVAVTNTSGKGTEIALNPEELGRVRLSMTAVDGAITLHMSTERPETQDLLRRHMDALAQEFRDLGYDTISFSFGQEKQSKQGDDPEHLDGSSDSDINEIHDPQVARATAVSSGLDLRI